MQSHKSTYKLRGWGSRGSSGRGYNPSRQGYQSTTAFKGSVNPEPSPPLGSLFQTLDGAKFIAADRATSNSNNEHVRITHSECVASFNWLDRAEPTVVIPGAPPAWTPLEEPRQLDEDKGDYFRDPNAARFPSSPQEPAVRSLLTEHEGFSTQDIDLFACSSTVGSLLRFVRKVDKPFRFFVEAVGNTVFFTRHENSPTQLIEGVRGYGHTFPEAYTTWDADVKGSASHQRLLRYDFAGLDCILRFECDGYLPSKVKAPKASSPSQSNAEDDDVSTLFDRVNVRSGTTVPRGSLQIKPAGRKIPQAAVFDLKTRSAYRKNLNVLEDELPRFWLAQIPNFILARHESGVFTEINVHDVQEEIEEWEDTNQEALRQLARLLRSISAAAKGRPDKKLEVCCRGLGALELREQDTDEHDALSSEWKQRWISSVGLQGEHSNEHDVFPDDHGAPADGVDVLGGKRGGLEYDSDEESDESKDYTACTADGCGYCGHCSY